MVFIQNCYISDRTHLVQAKFTFIFCLEKNRRPIKHVTKKKRKPFYNILMFSDIVIRVLSLKFIGIASRCYHIPQVP